MIKQRVVDAMGVPHNPCKDPRILSLVPSLTELLFEMGLGEHVVGRTNYCVHPADRVKRITSIGGTKRINLSRVQQVRPTHALVNVDENKRETAEALSEAGIEVIVTHPMSPDDNLSLFEMIGNLFDRSENAAELRLRFIDAKNSLTLQPVPMNVVYLIWKKPWMAVRADTYIARMLAMAGWQAKTPGADPSLSGDAARYPTVSLTRDALKEVDLILFSTEPFKFTQADIAAFDAQLPEYAGKAHLIDGEMMSWYGSRSIEGLRYFADFAKRIAVNTNN